MSSQARAAVFHSSSSGMLDGVKPSLTRTLAIVDVIPTRSELALLKIAGSVWAVMVIIPALLLLTGLA